MGEQIVVQKRGFRAFHSSQVLRVVKHLLVLFILCDLCKSKATDMKDLNSELHFRLPFCPRSACRANNTPALRTHALPPKIRSAPFRRGFLPRDKLGSPSTNHF
jgi:hypothetical protein